MMKRFLFFVIVFLSIAAHSNAQSDTIRLREISRQPKIVTDRPPQAVYFQLGGSGPLLSVNYDRRFGKKLNGAGFAAGIGYWRDFGIDIISIPVSFNYLLGRKTHYLELAGGTTFVSAEVDWFDDSNETANGFIHHINLGYRHQPAAGGFFFRGGVSPLFGGGDYATSFYLGFGYNF